MQEHTKQEVNENGIFSQFLELFCRLTLKCLSNQRDHLKECIQPGLT